MADEIYSVNLSDSISVDDTYEDTFIIPVQYDFENATEELEFFDTSTEELKFVNKT